MGNKRKSSSNIINSIPSNFSAIEALRNNLHYRIIGKIAEAGRMENITEKFLQMAEGGDHAALGEIRKLMEAFTQAPELSMNVQQGVVVNNHPQAVDNLQRLREQIATCIRFCGPKTQEKLTEACRVTETKIVQALHHDYFERHGDGWHITHRCRQELFDSVSAAAYEEEAQRRNLLSEPQQDIPE
jgi:superfamily II DNA helicase RecQ